MQRFRFRRHVLGGVHHTGEPVPRNLLLQLPQRGCDAGFGGRCARHRDQNISGAFLNPNPLLEPQELLCAARLVVLVGE